MNLCFLQKADPLKKQNQSLLPLTFSSGVSSMETEHLQAPIRVLQEAFKLKIIRLKNPQLRS